MNNEPTFQAGHLQSVYIAAELLQTGAFNIRLCASTDAAAKPFVR
jgi:hypothetical protein